MSERNIKQMSDEEQRKFNRRFKYAIYAYAVVELVVIALAVYYKFYR